MCKKVSVRKRGTTVTHFIICHPPFNKRNKTQRIRNGIVIAIVAIVIVAIVIIAVAFVIAAIVIAAIGRNSLSFSFRFLLSDFSCQLLR